MRHDIEVVIDRLVAKPAIRPRLAEAVELALKLGKGNLIVAAEAAEPEAAEAKPRSGGEWRRGDAETRTTSPPSRRPTERERSSTAQGTRAGDIIFSAAYACTHCGLSFEPPSPQLFSFNSPQGMCPECDGLGERFSFDPDLLVPERSASCRSRRAASSCSARGKTWAAGSGTSIKASPTRWSASSGWPAGTLLETPWDELDPELQDVWLWGTGDEHITYTWRGGSVAAQVRRQVRGHHPRAAVKLPQRARTRMHLRQLEKYMSTLALPGLPRPAAEPAGAGGQGDHVASASSATRRRLSLPRSLRPVGPRRGATSSASWSSTRRAR